jgi:rhamnogalacturonyl hydrolase YesR
MHGTWKDAIWLAGIGLSIAAAGCRTAQQARHAQPPPQQDVFSHWPGAASPREIGKRVAENFAARPFAFKINPKRDYVGYTEVCAWYGALTVAELTGDKDLEARLIGKFDPLLTTQSGRISREAHVDARVFGVVPLEIYLQTKDSRYLELGKELADRQWEKTTRDGITTEARYWIDDTFMITAVQVQAYRATGDRRYLDRAVLTLLAYIGKPQQTNGLFFHAPDAPFYWSRGNGWAAAGMTELLRSLPQNHPGRARILAAYKKMMAALLPYQGDDGLWRQLLDHPEAWPESSGTGMFAFAMVTGVKKGWLDSMTYGPAARKAWLGLINHLDRDANVDNVCEGTGKGQSARYYLDRQRNTGDLHGQAPLLWTAAALMR